MKISPRHLLLTAAVLLLGLAAACSDQAEDGIPETDSGPGSPTSGSATTEPAAAVVDHLLVSDYAEAQEAINADWDQFHADFDTWRGGLRACDRTAAEEAIRELAGDFAQITRQAQNLPGKGVARDLPGDVIAAATDEEASLRKLRDNWSPINPALLEATQTQRAKSAVTLRATQVAIDELEASDDPDDREIAKIFKGRLAAVTGDWDLFYDDYSALADEQLDLSAVEIVARLRVIIQHHSAVFEVLEGIPDDKVTDEAHDALLAAAESEAKGLLDLLEALRLAAKKEAAAAEGGDEEEEAEEEEEEADEESDTEPGDGDDTGDEDSDEEDDASDSESEDTDSDEEDSDTQSQSGSASDATQTLPHAGQVLTPDASAAQTEGLGPFGSQPGNAGAPRGSQVDPNLPGSGPAAQGSEIADYTEYFDAFEEILEETKTARQSAIRDIKRLSEGFNESDRQALAEFVTAFDSLMEAWYEFHTHFDEWVRSEGGCDRAEALAALSDHSQRFSVLGNRANALSQVSYLRPSSDLMAEAADREGAALRSLTSTWAPYESDVYRNVDEERANAQSLRRLAVRRVQELMERNGGEP